MKNHPPEKDLALHAGGDLPVGRRLAMAWHLRRCERCRGECERIRKARVAARDCAGLPPGLDWARLSAEMKANIRLGLEAGELASRGQERVAAPATEWRTLAIVAASLAVVTVAGWILERGSEPAARVSEGGILLRSTTDGLSVRWGESEAAIYGAGKAPLAAAVSWDGGARARFLDEETGQVTIYDVAAQ